MKLVCRDCGCRCQIQLADQQKSTICANCGGGNLKKDHEADKVTEPCTWCWRTNVGLACRG